MNKVISTFVASIILLMTFFAGYFYKAYNSNITNDEVKQKIETTGDTEIIKHSNIKQTAKQTSFTTTSTGEGKINTTIPNPELPKYTLLFNYSIKNKIGVEGLYRIENFIIGTGLNTNLDVYVTAGIVF